MIEEKQKGENRRISLVFAINTIILGICCCYSCYCLLLCSVVSHTDRWMRNNVIVSRDGTRPTTQMTPGMFDNDVDNNKLHTAIEQNQKKKYTQRNMVRHCSFHFRWGAQLWRTDNAFRRQRSTTNLENWIRKLFRLSVFHTLTLIKCCFWLKSSNSNTLHQ